MTAAVFPTAKHAAGMYESFYLRAVAPDARRGVWIRHTVHKAPGENPRGSVWITFWDGDGEPFACKETTDQLSVPPAGWIDVGGSSFGPARATGSCGAAAWELGIQARAPMLRHLRRPVLYRAPLPKTKLTSPAPLALFGGSLQIGEREIDLHGWRGMVGHNWGAEHAERWIWMHGVDFGEDGAAWIDVAIGRLLIAGRMTPWVANGAVSLEGKTHALGGLLARGVEVREAVGHADLVLPGADGLRVAATLDAPREAIVGWRYADPAGGEHDSLNCSVAALSLTVSAPHVATRTLRTAHGGVYELGVRERDHGVPLQPFGDG